MYARARSGTASWISATKRLPAANNLFRFRRHGRKKSFDTLIEAIQSGKTERLTQYLAFSSRFHRYSRRNQQLIFSQCPEATRVASYVKWKEEGYHVRKTEKEHGEHGIRILVPKFPKSYNKPHRRQPESQKGAEPEEKREDEYKVQEVDFPAI